MNPPIRNLDLHMLECFDMLMREKNVSRAAERLGLSQSSTSETLGRLRDRLGDPLLVRSREGMAPTPRAEELLPGVRAAIEQLRSLLASEQEFDPLKARQRFNFCASDYAQWLVLPELGKRLQVRAPGMGIDVMVVNILRVEQALEDGELDLALAFYPSPPPALRCMPLVQDGYSAVVRSGHPALGQALDAASFAQLQHVRVAPSGLNYFSSLIDAQLAALGLSRNITLTTPHFMIAALLVGQSDLVLVLPTQAALDLAKLHGLQLLNMPVEVPRMNIGMYWHERTHHSAPHRWLRSQIREVIEQTHPRLQQQQAVGLPRDPA